MGGECKHQGHMVRLSDRVYHALAKERRPGESFSDTVWRLLELAGQIRQLSLGTDNEAGQNRRAEE